MPELGLRCMPLSCGKEGFILSSREKDEAFPIFLSFDYIFLSGLLV
ncbi:MAG: hypothetical protein SPI30_08300 [Prevotella sp.]|nr:hypothetical protein [Prevotella sp.]